MLIRSQRSIGYSQPGAPKGAGYKLIFFKLTTGAALAPRSTNAPPA